MSVYAFICFMVIAAVFVLCVYMQSIAPPQVNTDPPKEQLREDFKGIGLWFIYVIQFFFKKTNFLSAAITFVTTASFTLVAVEGKDFWEPIVWAILDYLKQKNPNLNQVE